MHRYLLMSLRCQQLYQGEAHAQAHQVHLINRITLTLKEFSKGFILESAEEIKVLMKQKVDASL